MGHGHERHAHVITEREMGRIEGALSGLDHLCEGGVYKTLVKTISGVVGDIDARAQTAADADARIAAIRSALAGLGKTYTLAELIDEIGGFGVSGTELAALMGVHPARIAEARKGHARPGFKAKFAELFGQGR